MVFIYVKNVGKSFRCDESQNALNQLEELIGPLEVDEEGLVKPPPPPNPAANARNVRYD